MEVSEQHGKLGLQSPALGRRPRGSWRRVGVLAIGWLLVAAAALAQTDPDADPGVEATASAALLTLEAIVVEPTNPAPETLCRLRVQIRNDGDQTASLLGFEVQVAGQRLGVYNDDLFVVELPAGASTEIELFNFWSSETGRPPPAEGRWTVEVALLEARWVTVALEGDDQVWQPVGAVEGLPQRLRLDWGEGPEAAAGETVTGKNVGSDGSASDG